MADNLVSFYKVVPRGFNLLDATQEELYDFGIPQKPDAINEPSLFAFWEKLVRPPFVARQPTFRDLDSSGGPLESMLNWSGALIPAPWPQRFVFAAAGWTAPNVSMPPAQPVDTPSDRHKALVWVGLG